jgi:photosystem II stability/assembly factor-like uncharacterized protein
VLRLRAAGAGLIGRGAQRWSHRLAGRLAVCFTVVLLGAIVGSAQTRRPTNRPPAPSATRHPPFKAIFEPVPYPRDVRITGVFFLDADTGWTCGDDGSGSGNGGFIAATRDGGRTWMLQLGGANLPEPAIAHVHFFDATHGWASRADGTLLHTSDGSTWIPDGHVPAARALAFTSARTGFLLDADGVRKTEDGGRTWQPAYRCRVAIETAGLPGDSSCAPRAIAFAPDKTTGYLLADLPDSRPSVLIRTEDAGATWSLTTASVPAGALGIAVAGSAGWMVGSHDFSYTFDDGKRWVSRRVEFPEQVLTFTVVDADTGYVAGAHGMIYRFRIVPFDYAVPHMLTVPGMTTFLPWTGSPAAMEQQ